MIPFIECELIEFDICEGDKNYALSIKDKWGHTTFINIKEEKDWLGRIERLSFKDIFKSDNIRKYYHEGNTKKLMVIKNA